MFHREMLVWVIIGIRLVGAPTVGPYLCRAQQLPADAQDDTERLVVQDQRQTCHREAFPAVRYWLARARAWPRVPSGNALSGNALPCDAYSKQVNPTRLAPCRVDAPASWR